jgi:undecaprenyl-diphosphatase
MGKNETPTYELSGHAREKRKDTSDRNAGAGTVVWLIIAIILLVFGAVVAHGNHLTDGSVQAQIFHSINNLPGGIAAFMKYVVTDGLTIGALILALIVCLLRKKWRLAWRFLLTASGAYVVSWIVKHLVGEPRPNVLLHGQNLHARAMETGMGFPSSHTAIAAAVALTVWVLAPKGWRLLLALWILLVAFSRLYLGVHSPVDVLGGFATGLLAVCVVRLLPEKIARPLQLLDDDEYVRKTKHAKT